MEKRRPFRVVEGPDATMEVRRADGGIEFDAATDGYQVLIQRFHDTLHGLHKSATIKRMNEKPIVAVLVTGKHRFGSIDLNKNVLTPKDPQVAGLMMYGALTTFRNQDPAGFQWMLDKMRDTGLLS